MRVWRDWLREQRVPAWLILTFFWGVIAAAIVGDWWSLPFPYTHDAENHLARFMNTAAAIRQGQFPPRFAPDVASGYGFPVLHYNYPLANVLSVPFVWLKLHPATIFALQVWSALTMGAVSVWKLCALRFSKVARFAATLMFLTSSPLISMILWRGTIGEVWAYALVPVVIWATALYVERRSLWHWWLLVASATAFGLAHNVLLLMFAPWVAAVVLWLAWKARQLPSVLAAGMASIGLTLWFWLPALVELGLVVLQDDSLAMQAADHTLSGGQIWWSNLRFGFSFPGPLDSMGFGLGVAAFVIVCLFAAAVLEKIWRERRIGVLEVWAASALVMAVFLSSHASVWLWQQVPFVSMFQFPWRWLALAALSLIPLTAWSIDHMKARSGWRVMVVLVILLAATRLLALPVADRMGQAAQYYRNFPNTTTTRNENRPKTLAETVLPSWKAEPTVQSGTAELSVQSWNGSRRRYEVRVTQDAVIVEPTIYFPGWRVRANGQKIAIDTELAGGLVAYRLPQSEQPYQIETMFITRTWPRLIGEGLTALTLLSSILGSVWYARKYSAFGTHERHLWQKKS